MIIDRLRKISDFKSNEIENKSNLPKETLDKLTFIFKKLNKIYKLEEKEYNCNGYVCSIANILCYSRCFLIKLDNVDILISISNRTIVLYSIEFPYTIFNNNSFIDNDILNKDVFISLVENICTVVAHFHKDHKHILESEYDYRYFEESVFKSRIKAREDIVKFIHCNFQ